MGGSGSEEIKKCPSPSPAVLWFVNGFWNSFVVSYSVNNFGQTYSLSKLSQKLENVYVYFKYFCGLKVTKVMPMATTKYA